MKNVDEYTMVRDMNIAFGNKAGDPRDFLPMEDLSSETETHYNAVPWGRLSKQCMNILDEINELQDATSREHSDDQRDANCDIRVFVLGAAHFMGYDILAQMAPRDCRYEYASLLLCLRATYRHLAVALRYRGAEMVQVELRELLHLSNRLAELIGQDIAADMEIVVGAVMTRFVKTPNDLQATIDMHARKGVLLTYTEGDYPTMILKSSCDQPDAPKGKFLKSASCKKPVFPPLAVPLTPDMRSTLVDDGMCLSCIDDKCVTGPECVALSNPVATQGHP